MSLSPRVLVVDDEESVVVTLCAVFNQAGYVATGAQTLADAISQIEAERFDAAIVDLALGEDNGLDLIARLRQTAPETVAIILTGFGTVASATEAVRMGVFDYLFKPCSLDDLKASVARGLRRRLDEAERARVRVEEERARLHSLFMQAPAVIAVARGPDHVLELVNPSLLRLVGRTDGSGILGKPVREALPELVSQGYVELFDQVYRTGETFIGTAMPAHLARGSDGGMEEGFYTFVVQPLRDDEGTVEGLMAHAVEVTEQVHARRQAEEMARALRSERDHLRFLIDAGEVLASSLDYPTTLESLARLAVPRLADWCIVDLVTSRAEVERVAVVHADPAKVELARSYAKRYPFDPARATGVAAVLRGGQSEFYPELSDDFLARIARDAEHLRLMKQLSIASVMIVPLVARGRTLGAITFIAGESGRRYDREDLRLAEDLARRAALAVDNARLYQEAQTAIQARDEFLSVAAHELKTPITSLLGVTQVEIRRLRKSGEGAPEGIARALDRIERQSHKLAEMVGKLLDVARIEQGQLAIEPSPTDLATLVREVVAQRTRGENRLVTVDTPSHVEAPVDALRLEQVISNLVDNALKYSPPDQPVEVTLTTSDSGRVEIAVRDHGPGIPLEARDRVFDRYFQAHRRDYQSGLGLGLFVSKQIVDLHGGEIAAEFPPDGGCRFVVRLAPITPASSSSA